MTVTGSLPDGFKLSVEPVRWMVFAEWENKLYLSAQASKTISKKQKRHEFPDENI